MVRGYGVDAHGDCEERWSVVVAPPGSGLAILEVAAHEQREAGAVGCSAHGANEGWACFRSTWPLSSAPHRTDAD